MRDKLLLLLCIFSPLGAVEKKIALEEMRIELGDVAQQLKGQRSEIELLHDQLNTIQTTLDKLRQEGHIAADGDAAYEKEKCLTLDKRVAALEKGNKSLIADFKVLKEHLNSATDALAKCETKLSSLDGQLSQDIKTLKGSLQSMLALMQGKTLPEGGTYTVQPGDFLGKIAQEHHLTIRELKELNHLTSDQVRVGQKLIINK